MNWKDSPHPFALTTIFFWSLAGPLTRLALGHFSPYSLGFLRYFLASGLLLAFLLLTRVPPPRRRDLPWFLAAGFFGFFLYMIAFNTGQVTVTAAAGSVVVSMAPVLTALLARLAYGEALKPCQWAAIGVEFLGVLLLALLGGGFRVNPGLLWMLLAAVSLSTYNLLQRRLTKTYTGLQCSAFSIFAGTLLLAVFSPAALRETAAASPYDWACLLLMGIGCSAVAYVSWTMAFARAKQTSQVSNYMFLTPFLTSLFGLLIAREPLDRSTVLGGGVILAGVLLFHFGDAWRASLTRRG